MKDCKHLIVREYTKPAAEIVEGFKSISAATAHEAMGRLGYLDPSIKQYYPGMKVCGTAVTCECKEMDNLTLHAALHVAGPGDVLVCTMGNYPEQGPFGDCMATAAMMKGVVGLVIDSCIRDGETINATVVRVWQEQLTVENLQQRSQHRYELSECKRLLESGKLFLIRTKKTVVVLDKSGFTAGTPEEFRVFYKIARSKE